MIRNHTYIKNKHCYSLFSPLTIFRVCNPLWYYTRYFGKIFSFSFSFFFCIFVCFIFFKIGKFLIWSKLIQQLNKNSLNKAESGGQSNRKGKIFFQISNNFGFAFSRLFDQNKVFIYTGLWQYIIQRKRRRKKEKKKKKTNNMANTGFKVYKK